MIAPWLQIWITYFLIYAYFIVGLATLFILIVTLPYRIKRALRELPPHGQVTNLPPE
jgi:hypothetical protein